MLDKLIRLIRRKQIKEAVLIKERLMKILYNPFVKQYYWVLFNPKKRIWEWHRPASTAEMLEWSNQTIGEWKGEETDG